MNCARFLAYVTRTVDQKLLARVEYLAAENRILKAQVKARLKLSDVERVTLAEIGHQLAAAFSPRWRPWPGRTLSWLGIASWWPANSMARRRAEARAGRGSGESLRS
jgi:hypothetical protein